MQETTFLTIETGRERESLSLRRRKSPFGKITQAQPMISSNQCGRRKKRKGGCKKDGIQMGMERLCLNARECASVMAMDGLNPPTG